MLVQGASLSQELRNWQHLGNFTPHIHSCGHSHVWQPPNVDARVGYLDCHEIDPIDPLWERSSRLAQSPHLSFVHGLNRLANPPGLDFDDYGQSFQLDYQVDLTMPNSYVAAEDLGSARLEEAPGQSLAEAGEV